ncbi:MAG: hypothetical protein H7Y38_15550, partial [Armatimonadetes bacterium]|nr:hypothetical protein [Armatimonadota bacterium]
MTNPVPPTFGNRGLKPTSTAAFRAGCPLDADTEPVPPPDFLQSCLSTIPDAATYRTPAPRPFPDAASRKRLAWLSVAAAVPIVTVLAVLPAKLLREMKQNVPSQPLEYVRIHTTLSTMREDGRLKDEVVKVTIMDTNRGVVTYSATPGTWQPVSPVGKQERFWEASLTLLDGKQYRFKNDKFSTNNPGQNMWFNHRNQWRQFSTNALNYWGNRKYGKT